MTSLESFAGGRQLAVDFTAIERELAQVWKSASTAAGRGSAPVVMRACQLNLIVCCAGEAEAESATTTVASVTRHCPSRVLMTVLDPAASTQRLEASITAHCSYTPGAGRGKQVCCEQITITASGGAVARLPGAVLPLVLPDLPVVLWWPGDPDLASEVARRLIDSADRIVVDSSRFADLKAQLPRLASLDCPATDLAWQRLRSWREMTAGMFDGPLFEGFLPRLERIRVEHAMEGAAEAILLGSWAASRLRWRCAAPSGVAVGAAAGRYELKRPDGAAALLALQSRPASETGAPILALALETAGAVFSVRRQDGGDCMTATISLPDACHVPRTARAVARDVATLLCRSVETGGRDRIYDAALHLAARLLDPDVPEASR